MLCYNIPSLHFWNEQWFYSTLSRNHSPPRTFSVPRVQVQCAFGLSWIQVKLAVKKLLLISPTYSIMPWKLLLGICSEMTIFLCFAVVADTFWKTHLGDWWTNDLRNSWSKNLPAFCVFFSKIFFFISKFKQFQNKKKFSHDRSQSNFSNRSWWWEVTWTIREL